MAGRLTAGMGLGPHASEDDGVGGPVRDGEARFTASEVRAAEGCDRTAKGRVGAGQRTTAVLRDTRRGREGGELHATEVDGTEIGEPHREIALFPSCRDTAGAGRRTGFKREPAGAVDLEHQSFLGAVATGRERPPDIRGP